MKRFLPGWRQRGALVLAVALACFVVDQVSKLVAAMIEPVGYTHNPDIVFLWWTPLVVVGAAVVLPFRPIAAGLGMGLGGGVANLLDAVIWPGGTPDFIPVGNSVANVADFFIWIGDGSVLVSLLVWPVLAARRRLRRETEAWLERVSEGPL
jgi:lipoprotein signal peptidase